MKSGIDLERPTQNALPPRDAFGLTLCLRLHVADYFMSHRRTIDVLSFSTSDFRVVHITGELILQMEELDSHLANSATSLLAKLDLDSEPRMDGPSDHLIACLRQTWKTKNSKVFCA